MKEEKYYTPSIEEFHVGFEYEIKSIEMNDWEKVQFLFTEDHEAFISGKFYKTRVKYLDQEDIKSLGWQKKEDKPYKIEKEKYYYLMVSVVPTYYIITMHNKKRMNADMILFSGTIKNKSELKRLMKQLNITT